MKDSNLDVDVQLLMSLAGLDQHDDEFSDMDGFDDAATNELKAVLKQLQEEERQNKLKASAAEIRKLLASTSVAETNAVRLIRHHRREVKVLNKKLATINRAKRYALKTMNFMPLVSALAGKTDHQVPDDWVEE